MVCGLPSSGNRVLQFLLEKAGAYVTISHGPQSATQEAAKRPAGAVLLVRSAPFWQTSIGKQGTRLQGQCDALKVRNDKWAQGRLLLGMVGALAERDVGVVAVTYESLVDDPLAVFNYLCSVFGLQYNKPLGVEFYDANHLSDEGKPKHNPKAGIFRTPSAEPRAR